MNKIIKSYLLFFLTHSLPLFCNILTTILRPNFKDPLNTAQQMVDNNITMFGHPHDYHPESFNTSEDPALKKLAETYHIAETWDEFSDDFLYHIQTKGTHAYVYSYLVPWMLEMGKWWRSTEYIPGMSPYGVWQSRKNWYLNEVIFAIIFFSFYEYNT